MGEASARCWYELQGYWVYVPTGHAPDADFIVDDGERLIRVQVKTSGSNTPHGGWAVAICTRGGNQSWSGMVKRFSANRCDELFVATTDGRRWRIPAGAVRGSTSINLGKKQYAEFEVASGPPLGAREATLSLLSPTPAG